MKFCASTGVWTWTNWLTFEHDPDDSPDAGTGLLSTISHRLRYFAALPRLPASCAATRNFTSGKSRVARASRGFKMVLFTEPSEDLCLPSALLVCVNKTSLRWKGNKSDKFYLVTMPNKKFFVVLPVTLSFTFFGTFGTTSCHLLKIKEKTVNISVKTAAYTHVTQRVTRQKLQKASDARHNKDLYATHKRAATWRI